MLSVLLLMLLIVPPASLGSVRFLPAYTAPLLSFWKLIRLPLAFIGWRLGRVLFPFAWLYLVLASFSKLLLEARV